MNVRISRRAIADLVSIAEYVAAQSPSGARSLEALIKATIHLVAQYPGSGRPLTQRPAVRVMPVAKHPYLVFYTRDADSIVILHIRHGARQPVDPSKL